jgi:hypothetical protein
VVGLALLFEARHRRLEDSHALAFGRERSGDHRGDDGLADFGAGAGNEHARRVRASRHS